ncbi:MAG TPA: DUF3854 domain-containing protein [Verrucomicrobiae bacterium]|nr:DUF3854 domain-containing protein [Verrucomicrobiae bacterium]
MRPGITDETLISARIRRINADEAKELCGIAEAGLLLPYQNIDGSPILDGWKSYCRLRLENPKDGKKYHQASGTSVHAYLPPGIDQLQQGGDLSIIEGEFKSLALTEAGYAAIGISGFFGFSAKGGEQLVPELLAVIQKLKPNRILFCGDTDTSLNHQFSIAATRLAKLVYPTRVLLPRIPMDAGGKGVDDCRANKGADFKDWWQARVACAHEVKPTDEPPCLAMELFEREQSAITNLSGWAREDAVRRAVKLAASFNSHRYGRKRCSIYLSKN